MNRFSKPSEALGLDYVGSIKGNYLLVKIDYFNKLLELDVCQQADVGHTLVGIEKWEESRRSVDTLIIDGAKHFDNAKVKRWVIQKGVEHIKTLSYDHGTNAIEGRSAKSILQLLRKQQSAHLDMKWWDLLSEVEK